MMKTNKITSFGKISSICLLIGSLQLLPSISQVSCYVPLYKKPHSSAFLIHPQWLARTWPSDVSHSSVIQSTCKRLMVSSTGSQEDVDVMDQSSSPFVLNAQTILHELNDIAVGKLDESNFSRIQPFLEECVNSESKHGAMAAQEIMKRLLNERAELIKQNGGIGEERSDIEGEQDRVSMSIGPSTAFFNMVSSAWLNSGEDSETIAKKNYAILGGMIRLFENSNGDDDIIKPNALSFRLVLESLLAHNDRGMKQRLWETFQLAQKYTIADMQSYMIMIHVLSSVGNEKMAERANMLLREAVEISMSPSPTCIDVDVTIGAKEFYACIKCLVDAGLAQKANDTLSWMIELIVKFGRNEFIVSENEALSSGLFKSVINALAEKNDWESVEKAELLLIQWNGLYREGGSGSSNSTGLINAEPDLSCYILVLEAWSRLAKKEGVGGDEKLTAALKADAILQQMEQDYALGSSTISPDINVYTAVVKAYSSTKQNENAFVRVMEIVRKVDDVYISCGNNERDKPPSQLLLMALDTCANSKDAEVMTKYVDEYLLNRILELYPDERKILNSMYRSAIFGHSKNCAPDKAVSLIWEMIETHKMTPDLFCFEKCFEAYAKSGSDNGTESAQKSRDLFQLMEEGCELVPSERIYTNVIRAIGNDDSDPEKAYKAKAILDYMMEIVRHENVKGAPTIFTYNAVINVCASVKGDESERAVALGMAFQVFNELRATKFGPDQMTYSSLLRACANLVGSDDGSDDNDIVSCERRKEILKETIETCIEEGYLGDMVIRDIQVAAPNSWTEFLKCSDKFKNTDLISRTDLPSKWSRSIRKH